MMTFWLLNGFWFKGSGECALALKCSVFFQDLVRRTWDRGNNDEFLARAIKYAQQRKWNSLLKAFHTAIGKVCKAETLCDSRGVFMQQHI